jgi:DNA-binding CsgD family transcriptional regulator
MGTRASIVRPCSVTGGGVGDGVDPRLDPGVAVVATIGLLERAAELDRIDAALESSRAGAGVALLFEGEAGIGKTALLAEARLRAQAAGMLVLHARGTELEREYPLGVVQQCLQPPVLEADESGRERLLAGAASLAAPVVLDAATDEPVAPFGTLHGLFWLVANLTADRPTLVVLDDLQWADEPSLRFFGFLVRRVESLPLALVAAARVDEHAPADGPLALARSDPALGVLELAPLSEQGVAAFLRSSATDPTGSFARACRAATGGNPFLLGQLAAALREGGVPFTVEGASRVTSVTPPEIARAVRGMLARLDPHAVALARAVAVLGDDVPLDEVATLAGLEREAASEAAGRLARARLLDDSRPLRFAHPILREAAHATLSAADREREHRRAADLLAARGAPPERQALHLLVVEPIGSEPVVATLRAAARLASDRGALEPAVTMLRRALVEPPPEADRFEVLMELVDVEFATARDAAAAEHCDQAWALAPDPPSRVRALYQRRLVLDPGSGLGETLSQRMTAAFTELADSDRSSRLRLIEMALLHYLGASNTSDASPLLEEVSKLPGDTPEEARVLITSLFWAFRSGVTAAEIAEIAGRAAHQAGELIALDTYVSPSDFIVVALRWADRLDLAEQVASRALDQARRRGSMPSFARASVHLAAVRRRRGQLNEAEADARMAIGATEGLGVLMATGLLASILLDRGRAVEAWEALVSAGLTGSIPPVPPLTPVLLARMQVRVARGEHEAALIDWREAQRRRQFSGGSPVGWIEDQIAAAEATRALGDQVRARAIVYENLEIARGWESPGPIGQALRGVARIDSESDPIPLLREASDLLEVSPARLEYARAQVDLGAALRRAGARRDSRHPLNAGLELAQHCGADGLAETARQELAASGVRMRRPTLGEADELTASELRICNMASAGLSNAEIAQALFVTLKTVEMHLTRSYRKLDIHKRVELAAALARHERATTGR